MSNILSVLDIKIMTIDVLYTLTQLKKQLERQLKI